ncbi:MAG: hypothetical protein N4A46_09375 [Schleiferiaceae bacterium]|nr:hypothetical protein [Schleiferiaceae bacterium]
MKAVFQTKQFWILQRSALICATVGLSLGVLYSFGGLIIDTLVSLELISSNETPGLSYGTVLAFGALIGMPAIGFVFGVVLGLVLIPLHALYFKLK